MIKLIIEDLNAYAWDGKFSTKLKCILVNHAFHMVFLIRLGGFFRKKIPFIGGFVGVLIEYIIRVIYASDISCLAKISGGLIIMHGHDIVIGSRVNIGRNVKIFNGVTLGAKETNIPNAGQPSVGDFVVIGTGAKLLGGISIGSKVTVGANSVVIKNVESGLTVAGVPAYPINSKNNI